MKTKSTAFSGSSSCPYIQRLQPANAQSWVIGGNTVTKDTTLGTKSNFALRFITNNSERVRITSSGNVGIGTKSPSAKLDVVGINNWDVGNTEGDFRLGNSTYRMKIGVAIGGGGAGDVRVRAVGGTNRLMLGGGASDVLTISGSGNVGIGTTAPGFPLNFPNTLGDKISLWGSSGNHYGFGVQGALLQIHADIAASDIAFGYGSSSAFTERMRIKGNGNVGIGTKTPATRLEVYRNDGNPLLARFTNNATSIPGENAAVVEIQANGFAGNPTTRKWSYGVAGPNNTTIGEASFFIQADNFDPALFIERFGNVHIGTSLDVREGGIYTENTTGGIGLEASAATDSYAGWFDGDVEITGTLFGGSDRKLKQNIADFTSAMHIINQLYPKEYEFRHDGSFKLMHLPQGKHYGLIAQDVEQVLPNLVKESKFDAGRVASAGKKTAAKGEVIEYKSLNYTELIPVLVKAMQELSAEKDAKIADLQKQIDELKGAKTSGTQTTAAAQSLTKLVLSSASLDQNNPNPFTSATTIRYRLPASFKAAQIFITDNSGKTIKQVQLNTAGNGTVNIDASTLTSGTYNYTLVVDGRSIESKKMVVAH